MEENKVIITNEYPPERFNLLIPVLTMQEISPMHKVIINQVKIDPDPTKKDVYKQNGELALTKTALEKLMAAANVQVIDSRPIPTQTCNKCYEMAKATKLAPKCFECPNRGDVAYQATIAVPEPSGTVRIIKATKELRMADEQAKMTEAQFKQFVPFRTEQCETKALNRALRKGLMVKSTYRADELKKPFAIALVVPNFTDPEMKAAMIQRYANGESALFGGAPQIASQERKSLAEGRSVDTGTGEVIEYDQEGEPEVIGDDGPPWDDAVTCQECAKIIEATETWSVEAIVDYSQRNFHLTLCPACQHAKKKGV